jgi:ABC-type lipoprotein release transport system permease subunit
MLAKIAWRNVWRNKRRSAIVIVSVVVGVVALIVTDAIYTGMVDQMLYNQVGLHVGHLQIHRRGFRDDPRIQLSLERPARVDSLLASRAEVRASSARVLADGLVSSAYASSGIRIVGVDPVREPDVTLIAQSVVRGRYLGGSGREILLSEATARLLEVDLGDKVVVMASGLDGKVGSDAFRVVGLFRTFDSEFDKWTLFVPIRRAQEMLSMGERVSEFVAVLHDQSLADTLASDLRSQLGPGYEVLTYKDVLPLLSYQVEALGEFMFIYYVIIGIALVFGIVNTMLMAVLERMPELGVLKAIGMSEGRLFGMILLEAAMLGLLGTCAGVVIAYLVNLPLARSGVDLADFSESLTSLGIGSVVYPVLNARIIASTFLTIPLFAVLGAVYPALKAVRLRPLEAMRHV